MISRRFAPRKELIENLYDAIEGCLSIDMKSVRLDGGDTVMGLAV
jgi:hypothetical protein